MNKLRGVFKIQLDYSEYYGPRFVNAGLALNVSTADKYTFESAVDWPDDGNYSAAVERGVREGLAACGIDPDLGVFIQLIDAKVDPIYSSENAFFKTSKAAIVARMSITSNI